MNGACSPESVMGKWQAALMFLVFGIPCLLFARTIDRRKAEYYADAPRWYPFAYRSSTANIVIFRVLGAVFCVFAVVLIVRLILGLDEP